MSAARTERNRERRRTCFVAIQVSPQLHERVRVASVAACRMPWEVLDEAINAAIDTAIST